ncbi:MAG: cysteine hydrolase family protein [Mycobacteriales bacterium]
MAIDLAELLRSPGCALVTCELQNGVVGPTSLLPQLAEVATEAVGNAARLVVAARVAGVPVLHCVAGRRPDDRGSNANARIFAAMLRAGPQLILGTPDTDVVAEIGVAPSDFVLSRIHGLGPMAGTDLDPILRNLGVRTLVITGVSVNIAIPNLVMDAVNDGYQVVLVRDAVAGVPPEYAQAVIDHTLALLATVLNTSEVEAFWQAGSAPSAAG